MHDDAELRAELRDALPPQAFERQPGRAALAYAAFACLLAACTSTLLRADSVIVVLLAALAASQAWVRLWLLGQEAGHGALFKSPRLQWVALLAGGAAFLCPPGLWRRWHRDAHHGHTDVAGRDPAIRGARRAARMARPAARATSLPNRGVRGLDLFEILALPVFELVRVQRALWSPFEIPAFGSHRRQRARLVSLALFGAWAALAWALGPSASLRALVLPLCLANVTLGILAREQHAPHAQTAASPRALLETTASRKVAPWLDVLHGRVSHHVEHHLFPAMAQHRYPLVRAWLLERAPERFRLLGTTTQSRTSQGPVGSEAAEAAA